MSVPPIARRIRPPKPALIADFASRSVRFDEAIETWRPTSVVHRPWPNGISMRLLCENEHAVCYRRAGDATAPCHHLHRVARQFLCWESPRRAIQEFPARVAKG